MGEQEGREVTQIVGDFSELEPPNCFLRVTGKKSSIAMKSIVATSDRGVILRGPGQMTTLHFISFDDLN